MPDDETATKTAAPDDVLTAEIAGSADSYRRLGEIFVSVLGGLPGATLLAAFIRAPGETGLHEDKLRLGLALAVLAITLGVILAMRIRAPVQISASELRNFDMSKILATSQGNYPTLMTRVGQLSDAVANENDANRRKELSRDLTNALGTVRRVHLVATAEALQERVLNWKTYALAGVALLVAAVGVYFLALVPKVKGSETTEPVPVQVTLTDAGKTDLGCPTTTFKALKIGGSDEAPEVVALGGVSCTSGDVLELKLEDKKNAEKVEEEDSSSGG